MMRRGWRGCGRSRRASLGASATLLAAAAAAAVGRLIIGLRGGTGDGDGSASDAAETLAAGLTDGRRMRARNGVGVELEPDEDGDVVVSRAVAADARKGRGSLETPSGAAASRSDWAPG